MLKDTVLKWAPLIGPLFGVSWQTWCVEKDSLLGRYHYFICFWGVYFGQKEQKIPGKVSRVVLRAYPASLQTWESNWFIFLCGSNQYCSDSWTCYIVESRIFLALFSIKNNKFHSYLTETWCFTLHRKKWGEEKSNSINKSFSPNVVPGEISDGLN